MNKTRSKRIRKTRVKTANKKKRSRNTQKTFRKQVGGVGMTIFNESTLESIKTHVKNAYAKSVDKFKHVKKIQNSMDNEQIIKRKKNTELFQVIENRLNMIHNDIPPQINLYYEQQNDKITKLSMDIIDVDIPHKKRKRTVSGLIVTDNKSKPSRTLTLPSISRNIRCIVDFSTDNKVKEMVCSFHHLNDGSGDYTDDEEEDEDEDEDEDEV